MSEERERKVARALYSLRTYARNAGDTLSFIGVHVDTLKLVLDDYERLKGIVSNAAAQLTQVVNEAIADTELPTLLRDQADYREPRDDGAEEFAQYVTSTPLDLQSFGPTGEIEPLAQQPDDSPVVSSELESFQSLRYIQEIGRAFRNNSAPLSSPDENVERNRQLLLERSVTGLKKYGCTTMRDDLSLPQWLQHLLEELLDAANYIQAAKTRIEMVGDVAGCFQPYHYSALERCIEQIDTAMRAQLQTDDPYSAMFHESDANALRDVLQFIASGKKPAAPESMDALLGEYDELVEQSPNLLPFGLLSIVRLIDRRWAITTTVGGPLLGAGATQELALRTMIHNIKRRAKQA